MTEKRIYKNRAPVTKGSPEWEWWRIQNEKNGFTTLGDVPQEYTSKAGFALVVNDTEDGVEFDDSFSTAKWEDLRIEPVVRSSGVQAPAFEKWADDTAFGGGGTSRGVFLYSFEDVHTESQQDEVHFQMQMPHAWNSGAVHLHVHWVAATTAAASVVEWGLEYMWKSPHQVFGATLTTYAYVMEDPSTGVVAGKHNITEFTALTPNATQNGLSSILVGRVFRSSGRAGTADTYTGKAGLLYIDAHYQENTNGSRTEYVK